MKKEATIFTDGASRGNPGPGGWGAVITDGGRVRELGGGEDSTTNNRMELRAAFEALAHLASKNKKRTVIYTDSSYVVNGITKWLAAWKERGWVTLKKEEVLNQDLWRKISSLIDENGLDVRWKYVGGHVGIAGNERADAIATSFADKKKIGLYDGTLSADPFEVMNTKIDEVLAAKKLSSRARSRTAAYSYVSELDGVIEIHKTWAECEKRVKGKPARFKKATSAEEEARIIAEFSR
jgi:ribonuclease HI